MFPPHSNLSAQNIEYKISVIARCLSWGSKSGHHYKLKAGISAKSTAIGSDYLSEKFCEKEKRWLDLLSEKIM